MRTTYQIDREIAILRGIKPTGQNKKVILSSVAFAVEELLFSFDERSAEWQLLTDEQRELVHATRKWKEGESEVAPHNQLSPGVDLRHYMIPQTASTTRSFNPI